jgi:hypothetical protein
MEESSETKIRCGDFLLVRRFGISALDIAVTTASFGILEPGIGLCVNGAINGNKVFAVPPPQSRTRLPWHVRKA